MESAAGDCHAGAVGSVSAARNTGPSELLREEPEMFRARFRSTPLWRATPEGLARNAAVVLGNLGDPAAVPALEQAATCHCSPLVREHAAWALARCRR